MTKPLSEITLARRERQILDLLFAAGRATGQEIQRALPDAPSYSTVRTILRVLERKGYVRHTEEGLRYVYEPAIPRDKARKSALRRLLHTFFDGSAQQAVAALLDPKIARISREELDQLAALIEKAKKESEA
jgi:predicted transcriptional regulator